jgi:TonB family protein
MGTYFIFTIKASICLMAFYLFYKLLLSKETFHRFNRFALLGTAIVSMIIPVIKMTTEHSSTINMGIVSIEEFLQPQIVGDEPETLTVVQFLFILYILGVFFFIARDILSVIRLQILLRKGHVETIDEGIRAVVLDEDIAPFSWFRYIVISRDDYNHHRREIITHEQAHILLHHSVDVAFCNLLVILQWFNPAAWLLKRELQNVHEFEADEAVINKGVDATQYQMLLIRKSVGERLFSMANCLNHNSLKKRITMMTIKKSNPWSRLKYLYVIPVAAIAVVSYASPKAEEVSDKIVRESNDVTEKVVIPATEYAPISTIEIQDVKNQASPQKVSNKKVKEKKSEEEKSEEKIFEVVEQMPAFPGGQNALFDYLCKRIVYPPRAERKGIQGRVMVSFVITKEGKVTDSKVVKSVDPSLDKEALRVINTMPDWIPGYQKGEAVNVKFTVPVAFRLK